MPTLNRFTASLPSKRHPTHRTRVVSPTSTPGLFKFKAGTQALLYNSISPRDSGMPATDGRRPKKTKRSKGNLAPRKEQTDSTSTVTQPVVKAIETGSRSDGDATIRSLSSSRSAPSLLLHHTYEQSERSHSLFLPSREVNSPSKGVPKSQRRDKHIPSSAAFEYIGTPNDTTNSPSSRSRTSKLGPRPKANRRPVSTASPSISDTTPLSSPSKLSFYDSLSFENLSLTSTTMTRRRNYSKEDSLRYTIDVDTSVREGVPVDLTIPALSRSLGHRSRPSVPTVVDAPVSGLTSLSQHTPRDAVSESDSSHVQVHSSVGNRGLTSMTPRRNRHSNSHTRNVSIPHTNVELRLSGSLDSSPSFDALYNGYANSVFQNVPRAENIPKPRFLAGDLVTASAPNLFGSLTTI